MAFNAPNYLTEYYYPTIGFDANGNAVTPNAAGKALIEYYKSLLTAEGNDVDRAKRRLLEDYTKGVRINTEDYTRNITFGQESAGAARTEQALESESETRKLEGDLLKRGVSQGGLAETQGQRLKTRQDLRREAIDRALKKSEEDLKYSKERGLEEEGLKKGRGEEDLLSQFSKFKLQQDQEKQEKAMGLAEQAYQREFGKRSTEESFRLQQESLNKMS